MKKKVLILAFLTLFGGAIPLSGCCSTPRDTAVFEKSVKGPVLIDDIYGKFPNKIEIIFADIDGTTLSYNEKGAKSQVSKKLIQSIKLLQENHVPVVLVTGRNYSDVVDLGRQMGVDDSYFVLLQGARITKSNGEVIHDVLLPNQEVIKMLNEADKYKKEHKTDTIIYVDIDDKIYSKTAFVLPYNGDNSVAVKSYNDLPKGFKTSKIAMYDKNQEDLNKFQAHMKSKFPNYNIDLTAPHYCDISPLDATKGNGVKQLAKIKGVSLKNSAVFGDGENDISMINAVKEAGGISVAVGNALPNLKKAATYTTKTVDEDGFSYAVEKIIKNNALLEKRCKVCK